MSVTDASGDHSVELPPKFTRIIENPSLVGTITKAVSMNAAADKKALLKALESVIGSQEAMRAIYALAKDVCVMKVRSIADINVAIKGIDDIDGEFSVTEFDCETVNELISKIKGKPPKLAPPYMDVYLFSSPTESLVVLNFWHFVYDGPSTNIIADSLMENYKFNVVEAGQVFISEKSYTDYLLDLRGRRDTNAEARVVSRLSEDTNERKRAENIYKKISEKTSSEKPSGLKYVFSLLTAEESEAVERSCDLFRISHSVYWQVCYLVALLGDDNDRNIDYCYLIDLRPGPEFSKVAGFFGSNAMQNLHVGRDLKVSDLARKISLNNLVSIEESLRTEWLPPDVYSILHLNSASHIFSYEGSVADSGYMYNVKIDSSDSMKVRYFANSAYEADFLRVFEATVLRVTKVGRRFLLNVEHTEETRGFSIGLSDRLVDVSRCLGFLPNDATVGELIGRAAEEIR